MRLARPALAFVLLASGVAAQPAGFPSLAGVVAEMNTAATTYPAICELVDLTARYGTPTTVGGNRIHAVKISDHVGLDEDEPSFLLVSAHHGNEYGTPIVALDAIARLTQGYGSDPAITAIVDEYEIWIAPVWNPDGYPNSRTNGNGVDLNRNYPFLWSTSCNSGLKGPSPGSENETVTMLAFAEDRRFTKVLDFHSSGQEVLYAYRSSCNLHRLASWLRDEAIALSTASSYAGFVREPSSNGEHYQWQLGNYANYAFLTEISTTQSPTRASADAEAASLWPGTLWMLQRPIPVQGHVTEAGTGLPLEADISYVETPFTHGERNRSEPRFGRYHAFLPVGVHTLRFAKPGYVTREVRVNVTAGGVALDVALTQPDLTFAFPNGLPSQVAPGGGTSIRVDVLPRATVPQPGTGVVHVRTATETWSFPMAEPAPNTYEATLPAVACGTDVEFWFTADDTNGRTWQSPLDGAYAATTTSSITSIVADDFEVASGWVGGQPGDTATTGIWNRMAPQATAAQPGTDHSPAPGTLCWVTDGRAGTSVGSWDVDGGVTTLLSPSFDLSTNPAAEVRYWRWYSNNQNANRDDVLRVDVSVDDGAAWTNVETLGPLGEDTEGGWVESAFRIADHATPTDRVRVRFVAADLGAGSLVEAAIDDFEVYERACDGSIARLGSGCADATGTTLRLDYTGSVRLGASFDLGLTSGSVRPFALLGGADRFEPALTIPGTAGCDLVVEPLFSIGPYAFGSRVLLTLPVEPSLTGRALTWQAAIADPALAAPTKAAISDALETRFGS